MAGNCGQFNCMGIGSLCELPALRMLTALLSAVTWNGSGQTDAYSGRDRSVLLASPNLTESTSQKTKKGNKYGHDHSERRHQNLLQRLGYRTACFVSSWLAAVG